MIFLVKQSIEARWLDNQSILKIISNGIKFAFNTTPCIKISQPLNTKVQRMCSPNNVVTTNLFLSEVKYRLACNTNDELTNDLLDPKSKRTCVGVPKTIIILVIVSGLACASFAVIAKIQV